MYKSYQIQLVLTHAQAVTIGLLAYVDWIINLSFLKMRIDTFGLEKINYFNVIPWFSVMQLYVLIILKAVSMLNFICCNDFFLL